MLHADWRGRRPGLTLRLPWRGSRHLLRVHALPRRLPTDLGQYKAALDGLPAEVSEQVNVVMVSVDSERDTSEELGRYMGLFN